MQIKLQKLFLSSRIFAQSLLPLLSKFNFSPFLFTHPTNLPGFPMINAKSGMFFVTTAPAPIRAYLPIVTPHIIVAFAPIEHDFFKRVFS